MVGTATRSGKGIPVEARFSAPVQNGNDLTQPPIQWVTGLSRENSSRVVAQTTHRPSSADVTERV